MSNYKKYPQSNLLEKTKQLCKEYNIKPVRSRGQNFLITEDIYNEMIDAANLNKDDIVLEVGPGLGFLTERLAKKVKRVIAVELDDKLVAILKIRLKELNIRNVEVVNEDILQLRITNYELRINNFKVVANLPYNITSIFLRKFLSDKVKPSSMTLMLQKEVAERIVASPPKMSLLAVSVQFYAKPEIVRIVSKDNFWPQPEVDSAVIKLRITSDPPLQSYGVASEKDFFRLVKIGFSARRKMLKNNIASGLQIDQNEVIKKLKKVGLDNKIRAQELSLNKWKELFFVL